MIDRLIDTQTDIFLRQYSAYKAASAGSLSAAESFLLDGVLALV